MAQGAIKAKPKAAATKNPAKTKRGARVVKPKKASIISQNKIKHKGASGLVGSTEKLLAEKAGHLEMLKGGKRDKKEVKKAK